MKITKLITSLILCFVMFSGCSTKNWLPFTSQVGRFTIEFPEYPRASSQQKKVENIEITLKTFQVIENTPISYTVGYFDMPVEPAKSEQQKVLSAMSKSQTASTKRISVKTSQLTWQGRNAIDAESLLQFKNQRMYARQRILIDKRRVYQLVVITPDEKQSVTEVSKFFDSFKIIK